MRGGEKSHQGDTLSLPFLRQAGPRDRELCQFVSRHSISEGLGAVSLSEILFLFIFPQLGSSFGHNILLLFLFPSTRSLFLVATSCPSFIAVSLSKFTLHLSLDQFQADLLINSIFCKFLLLYKLEWTSLSFHLFFRNLTSVSFWEPKFLRLDHSLPPSSKLRI